jgi:hypothetical protein
MGSWIVIVRVLLSLMLTLRVDCLDGLNLRATDAFYCQF